MTEFLIGQRLLTRCFTPAELEYLREQAVFQKGVAEMSTIEDLEQLVTVGHYLILDRDEARTTARSLLAMSKRDP